LKTAWTNEEANEEAKDIWGGSKRKQ